MKIDCIIGIDPGSSGGIAVWKEGEPITVHKMPEELMDLRPFLAEIKITSNNPLVFLEKVQLWMGDMEGGKAFRMQKMLQNFQRLKDILEFSDFPFVLVHPMTWQSTLKLRIKGEEKSERKRRYKDIAQESYPEVRSTLWNCDAMLLVSFGRKKLLIDQKWILSNLPSNLRHLFPIRDLFRSIEK